MHILYFHQHFSTPEGSTGTRSYEMARHLMGRGHTVTMVCGSYGGGKTGLTGEPVRGIRRGLVDGIRVVEILLPYSNRDGFMKRSITFLRFAVKSIGIAWRTHYDLLFATSTPLTAGIPGIAMRLIHPRRPFVFEVRDLWPELPREMGVVTNPLALGAMSVLEWLSYNCANACIGLSPGIERGIRRRCSPHKPIAMIPNGCDLDLFQPRPVADRRPEPLRAVFAGAHGIANGLDAVLDAAGVLLRRGRDDIEILFIGDGKLKPALMQRAEREGLTNCLFFDPVPKRELADLMHSAHVALMILDNVPAFYYGTSPNKFFDYIASGIPVLNNYPGWLADMIREHHCGIACRPGDPDAFADALCTLADHRAQREEMGVRARRLGETQFARNLLARQFSEFLEATGGAKGGGRGPGLPSLAGPPVERPETTPLPPPVYYPADRDLTDTDIQSIAALHRQALRDGFLSRLGKNFLALLYGAMRADIGTVLIGARDKSGRLVGFVAGTENTAGFYRRFLRAHLWRGGWMLLRHVASPSVLRRATETLLYPLRGQRKQAPLPGPELLSIAVREDCRRSGVAGELFRRLAAEFGRRGQPAFHIVVGGELEGARRFYERMGGRIVQHLSVHRGEDSVVFVHECPLDPTQQEPRHTC